MNAFPAYYGTMFPDFTKWKRKEKAGSVTPYGARG
jgi:hypothetical protein